MEYPALKNRRRKNNDSVVLDDAVSTTHPPLKSVKREEDAPKSRQNVVTDVRNDGESGQQSVASSGMRKQEEAMESSARKDRRRKNAAADVGHAGYFYAVARGRQVGIFNSWEDCDKQVKRFSNCLHQKFKTEQEAKEFIEMHRDRGEHDVVVLDGENSTSLTTVENENKKDSSDEHIDERQSGVSSGNIEAQPVQSSSEVLELRQNLLVAKQEKIATEQKLHNTEKQLSDAVGRAEQAEKERDVWRIHCTGSNQGGRDEPMKLEEKIADLTKQLEEERSERRRADERIVDLTNRNDQLEEQKKQDKKKIENLTNQLEEEKNTGEKRLKKIKQLKLKLAEYEGSEQVVVETAEEVIPVEPEPVTYSTAQLEVDTSIVMEEICDDMNTEDREGLINGQSNSTSSIRSKDKGVDSQEDEVTTQCTLCSEWISSSTRSLVIHAIVHSGQDRLACPHCPLTMNGMSEMKEHTRIKHEGSEVEPINRENALRRELWEEWKEKCFPTTGDHETPPKRSKTDDRLLCGSCFKEVSADDRSLFAHIVSEHSKENIDYDDPEAVKKRFFPLCFLYSLTH